MNSAEIEIHLAALLRGEATPRATIALLVAGGTDPVDAEQFVFVALGGSDLVETGADGRERYPSGRLVSEVLAEMAK